MNRRLALAASVGSAVALVSGAVMVATVLSASPEDRPTPELASAAPVDTDSVTVTSLDPIVVYQDEYEYVVTGGQAAVPAGPVAQEEPFAASTPQGSGGAAAVAGTAAPKTGPAPTTTAAPAPATTATTRLAGVPADWPAGKPIPPVPTGCREPQLEDNGVWNCQH